MADMRWVIHRADRETATMGHCVDAAVPLVSVGVHKAVSLTPFCIPARSEPGVTQSKILSRLNWSHAVLTARTFRYAIHRKLITGFSASCWQTLFGGSVRINRHQLDPVSDIERTN